MKIHPVRAAALLPFTISVLFLLSAADAPAQPPGATATLCRACHADRFATIAGSPHGVLDTAERRAQAEEELSCIACHGDVGEHIRAGGRGPVFAFPDQEPLASEAVCLGCHGDTHPRFQASPHARAGVTCSDCHSVHDAGRFAPALLHASAANGSELGAKSAVCVDCHQSVSAQFALNERHSLQVLECTSCHDPHAPAARPQLGGIKQQACAGCHADKEGPFVFEHQASRVEGCTVCHSPHGSPNRHLLTHQRTGELCYSCHAVVPQFHAGFAPVGPPRFGLDTQCTNCHSAIHGSNLDPAFLR